MSADLHIHILEGIEENDLRIFHSHTFGSKYFNLRERREPDYGKIDSTPNVWIGEVSWLKAAITEDEKTFVPPTVAQVSEIIGEDLPVIDDELIEKIVKAFDAPNTKGYSITTAETVRRFLEAHKGKRVFTVSW